MDFVECGEFYADIKLPHDFVPVDGLRPGRLPGIVWRNSIGCAIHCIGWSERAAKGAVVVVTHPRRPGCEHYERERGPPKEQAKWRPVLSKESPSQQNNSNRKAKKYAFVWSTGSEQDGAHRHKQSVAQPHRLHEPRQRSQHESSTEGRNGPAPGICIDPVAEEADSHDGYHASEQSPCRRQPCLQHPADGSAHQRHRAQNPKPWMPEQHLARCQNKALRGKVHRHVRGLHGDLEALEMLPHNWRGVSQSSRCEGISGEQEAEIILDKWQRNGAERKDSKTQQVS